MDYLIQYSIYVLILSVLMGVSTWKLFQKMGYNPIFAFVPFYNYYIILKETNHSKWWSVLAYFPIVGAIMMSVFHLFLMRKFGKISLIQKIMTVFLPFIYMATVNYAANPKIAEIDEDEEKKETFLGSITFAVVFATIIHAFVTQPFAIPTGSMERTLLVGDFLFVNKWSYGYRMPMRPLALPFLQGTIFDKGKDGNPKNDPKSYVDAVKLPYWRLLQFNKPQKNDIVVFNYPGDSVHTATDRKDPYVKRCVAVAGDVLEVKAGKLYINGKPETVLGDQEIQKSYLVYTTQQIDVDYLWKTYGYLPLQENSDHDGYVYQFQGLTDKLLAEVKQIPGVVKSEEIIEKQGDKTIRYFNEQKTKIDISNTIFPINKDWNPDWYGPLTIPKTGDVITLTKENLPEYQKLITDYEHNTLVYRDNLFFINGKLTNQYTVKQDYYFMMGDNRDASLDARFFGFVPSENIVGRPMFTWLSLQGVFDDGPKKIRWDRMFKATNTGEKNKTSYWFVAVAILVLFFGWDYIVNLIKGKKKEE